MSTTLCDSFSDLFFVSYRMFECTSSARERTIWNTARGIFKHKQYAYKLRSEGGKAGLGLFML
jgi:hypothetical protein